MLTKELVKQSPWPFFIVMDGPGPATSRHWAEMARSIPGSGLATATTMTKGQSLTRSARPGKSELQLAETTAVETIERTACRCSNIVPVTENDKLNDQITLYGEIESNHQRVR